MKKTPSQHCWRKGACQKVNCPFVHPRGRSQYCRQKDACVTENCKFVHPRDTENSSLAKNSNTDGGDCLQSRNNNDIPTPIESTDSEKPRQTIAKVRSISTMTFYNTKLEIASNDVSTLHIQPESKNKSDVDVVRHYRTNGSDLKNSERNESSSVVDMEIDNNRSKATTRRRNKKKSTQALDVQSKLNGGNSDPMQSVDVRNADSQLPEVMNTTKGKRAPRTNSDRSESSSRAQKNVAQERRANMNACASIPFNQSTAPIQPEWINDEAMVIVQHRQVIEGINDKISQIILSEDYIANYEKHEASIRILRDNLVELESHVSIYDSVKSRAWRELSSRPTELRNQIFREIYRLKCRLGAFTKRLDMEKYFGSGDRFLIVQGETGSGKSTQIPQYVADHPRFYGKKIVCTQPRKLAAISLSRRVAFEYSGGIVLNNSSSYIGCQVGGDRRQIKGCRIEFVTEGIMLERIMDGTGEPFKDVGCIIVDEAHQRSITCDLLLGSFRLV